MFRIFSQYVSLKAVFSLVFDAFLITAAMIAALRLRYLGDWEAFQYYSELPDFAYRTLVVVVCFLVCSYYSELYNFAATRLLSEQFFRLSQALGASCFVLAFLYFAFPFLRVGRGVFLLTILLTLGLITASRLLIDTVWHTALPRENVLILGSGKLATDIAREISLRQDLSMNLQGFVSPRPSGASEEAMFGRPVLGVLDDLEKIVAQRRTGKVIVALEEQQGVLPVRSLLRLRTRGVRIEDAHSAMAALTGRIPLETVRSTWFIFSDGFRRTSYGRAMKRAVDLGLSLTGLLLSIPLMALAAAAVKIGSPGAVLYRQRRVGLNGACFEVIKFRTMRADAEADGVVQWAAEDDPRVTRLGRILRKYRIDELPQFVNVIRGEMSFVGPRPERPEFVESLREEIPFYDERHTVRPGITGWAQVNYPYGASVKDALRKLEYDLFYLKNISIFFDCAIVLQTVKIVLFGRGR